MPKKADKETIPPTTEEPIPEGVGFPPEPKPPTLEERLGTLEKAVGEIPSLVTGALVRYDQKAQEQQDLKFRQLFDELAKRQSQNLSQSGSSTPPKAGGDFFGLDPRDILKELMGGGGEGGSVIGFEDLLKENQKLQLLGYRNFLQQQNRDFARRFGLPFHETESEH